MAVSHQWFIQWSPPSMILADITNKYEQVNERLNVFDHERTRPWEVNPFSETNKYSSVGQDETDNRDNGIRARDEGKSERARAAGLTLWMAALGVARAQTIPADNETPPFTTLYKWKTIDFVFPSNEIRELAITRRLIHENIKKSRVFIPQNVLPLGLEVYGSRVWVTLPRWRSGVPATLATVPRAGGLASPPLKPYPNWSFHRAHGKGDVCSNLTSVFRVNADPCGRLWVLDSGRLHFDDNSYPICPPSIVVFDMKTDTVISRYKIPFKYVLEGSLFSNILIDTQTEDCSDLHAYIVDTWRFGLVVFRERDAKFWKFSHHLFYPDPLASNYTLHGLNFQWTDGIFGLALTQPDAQGEKLLYFHPMSSNREFYVSTSVLQDRSRVNDSANEFHLAGESRGIMGQSSASAIDRQGVMFYGLVTRDSIGCWDTRKPYQKKTTAVVAMNKETLIFPNDIKIDQDERQNVWVLSNRLPMFQAAPLDLDDYNYRIMFTDSAEAVKHTICDPAPSSHYATRTRPRWLPVLP